MALDYKYPGESDRLIQPLVFLLSSILPKLQDNLFLFRDLNCHSFPATLNKNEMYLQEM